MLVNGQLHNMVVSSHTKNVLWKIYHEKNRLQPEMVKERAIVNGDRCLLPRNPKAFALWNGDMYHVGEKAFSNLMIGISASLVAEGVAKTFWMPKTPIYEYGLTIYYNGDKPKFGMM